MNFKEFLLTIFLTIGLVDVPANDEPGEDLLGSRVSQRAPAQGEIPKDDDHGILYGPDFNFLDRTKNSIYLFYAESLQILDSEMSGGIELEDKTFQNRFRLSPYVTYESGVATEYDFTFDFEANIHLRRTEKRVKLVIDNGDLSPLPDTLPDEEDNDAMVGIQQQIRRYGSVRVGAKVKIPPVGYVIGSWSRLYHPREKWSVRPQIDAFYRTDDDGFGNGANLLFGRWWDRYRFKSSTGYRITEATTGFEWASAWSIARVTRLIEKLDPLPLVSTKDLNEGLDLTYRISGHISGSKTIDEHRVTLTWRYPIRKNWCFLVLGPELRWKRVNDWAPEKRLQVGIDILFWGVTRY